MRDSKLAGAKVVEARRNGEYMDMEEYVRRADFGEVDTAEAAFIDLIIRSD